MNRIKGKVLWFDERDGNGIVVSTQGNKYYVDISVTEDRQPLKPGQRVRFERNFAITDCLCGHKVQVTE